MHFFYIDESGDTGNDLENIEQPIFVIGGISVRDEGWRKTNDEIAKVLKKFFGGTLPDRFELHAHELFNQKGFFRGCSRVKTCELVFQILDVIADRKHKVHFVGIDKKKLKEELDKPYENHPAFVVDQPYFLGFNYLLSYIESYVKKVLGKSARGMIILDEKEGCESGIDAITHFRRYEVAKARQLKWLVEFSYPVDSVRHPMVQLSDFVIYIVRKFLELEGGYRDGWLQDAKEFYAKCYDRVSNQVQWKTLIGVSGKEEKAMQAILSGSQAKPSNRWRTKYNID